jgi:hypothetical protein
MKIQPGLARDILAKIYETKTRTKISLSVKLGYDGLQSREIFAAGGFNVKIW